MAPAPLPSPPPPPTDEKPLRLEFDEREKSWTVAILRQDGTAAAEGTVSEVAGKVLNFLLEAFPAGMTSDELKEAVGGGNPAEAGDPIGALRDARNRQLPRT